MSVAEIGHSGQYVFGGIIESFIVSHLGSFWEMGDTMQKYSKSSFAKMHKDRGAT